jgi:molecular chaperone DnaK
MSEMINFGIDLGTTNSLVAKFNKGTVEVFKNPIGFRETLPSVVGFRKDRILVGDQARTYAEKDPKGVLSRFKRKMGTTETFPVTALGRSVTPAELSAFVLKELKTFIHTGETPEAAVITIPASFDMVQSNATKEAGHAAGFRQVVLLQEPIAASLAYANREKNLDLKNSQWLVYDLGGGTFDVALVRIVDGELKIIDHEGDNYLGGADFDALIVEKIVVPQLEARGQFTDMLAQMKDKEGRYNKLWYALLNNAEDAKIELSARTTAEINLPLSGIEDEDGNEIDDCIPITRSEYEAIIKGEIDRTIEMVKTILTRNSLRPQDLQFVLMVGGSTLTPFVRKRVEERLGIPVNTGINPTNAVAVGAAYYAGTKALDLGSKPAKPSQPGALRVKAVYNRASQDAEELFSAKVEGAVTGLFYRITRDDGGYDSGLRPLASRITEDLPLQSDAFNIFTFKVCDGCNNPVPADFDSIQIAQGGYQVAGQPLPDAICLVTDDERNFLADQNAYDTKLDCLWEKNRLLPATAKRTVEASKTVVHGSDEELRVIVVEGPKDNHSTANKTVGCLSIAGKQLKRDLLRGTDIDLSFELSESRELTVRAYVNPSGPEFSQVYTPINRGVSVDLLADEVEMLEARLEQEQDDATDAEKYEVAAELKRLHGPVGKLRSETLLMTTDDASDDRYKLEDRKRKIAQQLDQLTAGKQLDRLRNEYQEAKVETTELVNENGNDQERRQLEEIVARERTVLTSKTPKKIEDEIRQLRRLAYRILRRTPGFLTGWFERLVGRREAFNDQFQANNLIDAGRKHVAAEDWERLAEVNERLYDLLPQRATDGDGKEKRYFAGIKAS